MSERVTTVIEGGVGHVRLNRPDKLNALDPAMFRGIVEAGEALKGQRSVRAVVVSGEGRGFCAGLDFASFQAMAAEGNGPAGGARGPAGAGGGAAAAGEPGEPAVAGAAEMASTGGRITHLGQQASWVWTELAVPVIAAVHGVALGGGLQVALGADIRIVAPGARLSVLEVRWGLTPDMTATWFLPRLVGPDVAKELTFTGRMVSGEEAVRIGLATRVSDDPVAAALDLAAEIAAKSPLAVRGAKRLIDASIGRGAADQFADERVTIAALMGTPDQVEAVRAYFDKRDPVFSDPA